jgi:polyisoprenoid-binding protein YceI
MRYSRLLLAAGLFLAVVTSAAHANEVFKIDPEHSTIEFKVRHLLGTARGRFTKFSGTIDVDRERPEESSVTATIQAASLDTGIAKRDGHLRGADFFNVQKFPEITFKSRHVKSTGSNAGEIVGDLTMHGVTRPMTLRVLLAGSPEPATKNRTTRWRVTAVPIKRSEFGLVWSKSVEAISMIGDDVSVDMKIEALKAP